MSAVCSVSVSFLFHSKNGLNAVEHVWISNKNFAILFDMCIDRSIDRYIYIINETWLKSKTKMVFICFKKSKGFFSHLLKCSKLRTHARAHNASKWFSVYLLTRSIRLCLSTALSLYFMRIQFNWIFGSTQRSQFANSDRFKMKLLGIFECFRACTSWSSCYHITLFLRVSSRSYFVLFCFVLV